MEEGNLLRDGVFAFELILGTPVGVSEAGELKGFNGEVDVG